MDRPVMALADLDRRLSRKVEIGGGLHLSPADVDLLVTTGAYDTFRRAVTEAQRELCQLRNASNRSTSVAIFASSDEPIDPISRSSGTIENESASEALARAQWMSKPAGQRSTDST